MKTFDRISLMSNKELEKASKGYVTYVNNVADSGSEVNDYAYALLASMAALM